LYYYHDGKLVSEYQPQSHCLLAPGDVAWASDLEALRKLNRGEPADCTLAAVAAKYLINEHRDAE
jgi:hypothetical protein